MGSYIDGYSIVTTTQWYDLLDNVIISYYMIGNRLLVKSILNKRLHSSTSYEK